MRGRKRNARQCKTIHWIALQCNITCNPYMRVLRDGLMDWQAGFMVDVETIEHINGIENLFDEKPINGFTRNK